MVRPLNQLLRLELRAILGLRAEIVLRADPLMHQTPDPPPEFTSIALNFEEL